MLTQETLRHRLLYNPDTGIFSWRDVPENKFPGKITGTICCYGYQVIQIDNVQYRGARLAWLYMTGEWPAEHIDHRDGNEGNDAWSNLRAATRSQNMCNSKLRADNSSGARGVSWNKRKQKWHVRVNVNGRLHHCGYFDDFEEAKLVRDMKAKTLHGAFARIINSMETTL